MAIIYKAPEDTWAYNTDSNHNDPVRIFLAGSIDMGAAENWQERIERELAPYDVVICNPRRDDWDSTWQQTSKNPKFHEQVSWELSNIENADLIVFYFDPNGQAPITLMELGLSCMQSPEVVVCCPDGYWRKGNVEMVCERYGIPLTNTMDEFVAVIKTYLECGFI